MNIFEYAARNKLRFFTTRGEFNSEQLWDVPLRSKDGFDLNAVAVAASKALKGTAEESFVEAPRTNVRLRLEIALDLVKHIIESKLSDEKAAEQRAADKIELDRLTDILAEKQDAKRTALSENEIKKRIAALKASSSLPSDVR